MDDDKHVRPERLFETKEGGKYRLPLFLPVYDHRAPFIPAEELKRDFAVEGIIMNAFMLYKDRETREHLLGEEDIKEFSGFDGMVVTDSGAFQGFRRPLYLSNRKIIKFQQDIGADVISPLDIVTTPGENRLNAAKKMRATLKRVREGLEIADRSVLIGVQQGGRFAALRNEALDGLVEMGVEYIALGSLVPFFNRNHDVSFVCDVLVNAQRIVPHEIPVHIYGAGDPVEIPFYVALGAGVFDSSSFAQYARDGWYMTPYGAVKESKKLKDMGEDCTSPYIKDAEIIDEKTLARHNLYIIMLTMARLRKALRDGKLDEYLNEIITVHTEFFPESLLRPSLDGFADKL